MAATRQSLAPEEYEVIVVDNGSTDHTSAFALRCPGVRYLYSGSRGLSSARNTGTHAARSPIVAFIDDDAIADLDLLKYILSVFDANSDAGCVGGLIELALPAKLPRWFRQEFAGYYSAFDPGGACRRVAEMQDYPFGANLAFRKDAIERAGYFSEKLGRVGRDQSGGEELDLQCRIARLGYGIYCTALARVQHVIMPERLKWSHIANSAKAAGRNWAYYELELYKKPVEFVLDLKMLAAAIARLADPRGFYVAYSQVVFYRAKIFRKLRYYFSISRRDRTPK